LRFAIFQTLRWARIVTKEKALLLDNQPYFPWAGARSTNKTPERIAYSWEAGVGSGGRVTFKGWNGIRWVDCVLEGWL